MAPPRNGDEWHGRDSTPHGGLDVYGKMYGKCMVNIPYQSHGSKMGYIRLIKGY